MRLTWRQLKRKSKDTMVGGRGQIVNGGKRLLAAYKAISQKAKQRGCWGCGLEPGLELGGTCVLPSYASLATEEASVHRATGQQRVS